LKAALKVFSKHGYHRASVNMIAREARVSKALIYWYFRSKRNLVIEIAEKSLPIEVVKKCLNENLRGRRLLECIGSRFIEKYRSFEMRTLFLHTLSLENTDAKVRDTLSRLCEKELVELSNRVFGECSQECMIKLRMFFGALILYIIRPPTDISEEEYINMLVEKCIGSDEAPTHRLEGGWGGDSSLNRGVCCVEEDG